MDDMKREAEENAQRALRNAGAIGGFIGGGIGGALVGTIGSWIEGKFKNTEFETTSFKVRVPYEDAYTFVQIAACSLGLPDKPAEKGPEQTRFFILRKKGFFNIPVGAIGVTITRLEEKLSSVEVVTAAKSGLLGTNGAQECMREFLQEIKGYDRVMPIVE